MTIEPTTLVGLTKKLSLILDRNGFSRKEIEDIAQNSNPQIYGITLGAIDNYPVENYDFIEGGMKFLYRRNGSKEEILGTLICKKDNLSNNPCHYRNLVEKFLYSEQLEAMSEPLGNWELDPARN